MVAHKNPFFKVRKDDFVTKSGKKSKYYTVIVDPFVVICGLSNNHRNLVVVKSWRYPLNSYHLELPAGRLDKNETPLMAAKREFLEETGYKAKKWKSLGWFHLAPGISNQKGYVFLADHLEKEKSAVIDQEIVQVKVIPLTRFRKMLKEKKLTGAPTLAAAQRLLEYLSY